MKIFLSGPMSGLPEFNYPAFHAEAVRLRDLGYEVISPAELFGPAPIPGSSDEKPHSWYLTESIKALLTCEAIQMLPNWSGSKGACLEFQIAMALNLKGVYKDATK